MTSRTQVRRRPRAWNQQNRRTVDRVTAALVVLGLVAACGIWAAVLAK